MQSLEQLREAAAADAAIAAPHRGVLRDQDELFGAAGDERARFGADRFGAAAAELPAQRRDDAERARVIAAFGDLEIGGGARRRDQARQEIVLGLGFEVEPDRSAPGLDVVEQLGDARIRPGADDAVDLRNQTLQLLAVTLRQTTGDDQLLSASLACGVLEDHLRGFGLGRIDEGARVDHHGIGLTRLGLKPPAGRAEFGEHHLGIDEILRTAQADERDATRAGQRANDSLRTAAAARTPSNVARP